MTSQSVWLDALRASCVTFDGAPIRVVRTWKRPLRSCTVVLDGRHSAMFSSCSFSEAAIGPSWKQCNRRASR